MKTRRNKKLNTYTIETIIQAGHLRIPILNIPIRTNKEMRPSRLISGIPNYLQRSFSTIFRSLMTYEPMRFFLVPAISLLGITIILGIRYLYFFSMGEGKGHVQSLILALAIFVFSTSLFIVGFLADLIAVNRQILEGVDYRLRKLEAYQVENLSRKSEHVSVFNRAYLIYPSYADRPAGSHKSMQP